MRTLVEIEFWFAQVKAAYAIQMQSLQEALQSGGEIDATLETRLQACFAFINDVQWRLENTPEDTEVIIGQIYKIISFVGISLPDVQDFYNSQVGNTTIVVGNGVNFPLATNSIYGRVRLSVPAVVASDPIAVGDNDPRLIDGATAYDDTVTAVSVDALGRIVLTKRDGTTLSTTSSNILNQTSSAQAGGFWIDGNGTIEGDLTLPSLVNDTVVNKFAVFDAQNIMKYVTSEQLLSIIGVGALTASRAVVTDSLGALTTSSVTTTELGYLSGVTSAIQTQLGNKQPLDADLTAIAALTANGLLRKTAGTWGMDTNTYLTANQTITLTGPITGSGSTTIATTIANNAVSFAKMQNINTSRLLGRSTASSGNIEELTIGAGLSLSAGALASTITQYTNAMARLAISSGATGLSYNNTTGVFTLTSGYSIPTDSNQTLWTSAYSNMIVSASFNTSDGNLTLTQQDGGSIVQDLDGRYLIGNESITLTGNVTGSGTTAITTTIASQAVTFAKMQNVSSGTVLGRSSLGSGSVEEITIGTGLTLSGGILSLGSLTTNRALVTNGSGVITSSTTSATQIGYLDTLSSNAQTQIDGKQPLDATLTALSGVGSSTLGLLVLAGVDTFVTRILEGTAGRISVNNANGSGTNPSIDIASTYAGQSTITTVGAITVGAWQGSSIADGYIVSAGAWNEAYDEKINSFSFNTSTGIFTGVQQDGGSVTASLDGRYLPLTGGTLTGYLTLNGDPISALHAATKQYVDNIATGISPKGSVNAATTTTLPSYSGATLTLTGTANGALAAQDGATLTLGQYLLVKNETGANEKYNGIYELTTVGNGSTPYQLTRISTANAWAELVNATVYVAGGSTLQGYTFYQTAPAGGTLGTTAVTWVVFSISTVYLPGSGIDITGSTISVATGGIVDSMVSASAAITLSKLASVTANKALVSDSSGYVSASAVTSTELGYVAGVTSAIQTQINGKQPLDATLTALAAFNSNGIMVQTAADTFTSRTITGTSNRLSVTNGSGVGGDPTLDISSSYVGQATITTLGTIGTGVWNGTAIGDTYISSAANWNTAYNNMIVSASFGTADGILTLTQQDAGTVTVDLDGRYLLGNEAITISGEASGTGTTSISVTLANSAVIGKVLTGYVSGAGVIASTDTILQAIQKLNGNIGALVTGVSSVSGTTNRITSSGGSTPVIDISASYVGQTSITTLGVIGAGTWQGAAIADTYISSATNWNTAYTNRITSLTVTGSSGSATLISNTLNIPTYTLSGLGGVPYTGATTNVNLGVHSLTASDLVINHASGSGVAASISKGGNGEALTVVKNSGSGNAASITGGTTLISELNLTTDLADAYIASAATWNAKQNAITLTTTGSSGAATLVSNTLNIPTYTLAGLGGQPLATNLTSLSGLSYVSTSFVKMTTAGTFALDTNTYITGNQTITLSGDISGSGTTAITTTIGALKVTNAMLAGSIAASKLVGTDIATVGTITSGVWNAGAVTSSGGISGTTGAFSSNVSITGNLTVDSGTFFVDATNNRVGIGTTSPLSGMMHIYGTAGASAVRWSETITTVGFVGGANGLVTGKNGSFMVRGEAGLVLSGVGNGNNLYIDSTGDIQTAGATDTGEHFIIGGSGRINGTATITGAVTGSSTAQFTKLGLGNVPITGIMQRMSGSFNEAYSDSATYGILNDVFLSTAPTVYRGFTSSPSTNTGGTLTEITHFRAAQGAFVGTPALQVGYQVSSLMTGATLNYGFQGLLAAATGRWNLYMSGTASNYLAGALGIGTNSLQGNSLTIGKSITGATTVYNVTNSSTIQSDVTSVAQMYRAEPSTNASAFTIATIVNYQSGFGTKGAGSTITDFIGYNASDSSVATNTYGFKGNVTSGTGKWNIYMGGTAANYLAGNLQLGSTTTGIARAFIVGDGTLTVLRAQASTTNTPNLMELRDTTAAQMFTVSGVGNTTIAGTLGVTGNLTVDTNTFFIDASANRVGVGTITPQTKFDVVGGIVNSANSTSGFGLGITAALPNGVAGLYHSDGATTGYTYMVTSLGGFRIGVEGRSNVLDIVKTTGASTFSSTVTATGVAAGSVSGLSYANLSALNTTYGATANLLALGTFDGTYNPRVIVSYTTSVGNPALLKFASTYSSGWGATNYSFESGIFMIGTATVAGTRALQVTGGIALNNSIIEHKSAGSTYYQTGFQSGANYAIYNSNFGRYDLFIQQTTGNVQIGSSTPTAGLEKLQVTGSASISSTLAVTGAATFSSSVTAVSLSLTTGNFNLGTSSNAGVVNMYNASAVPTASITNGVILYAQDVDPGTGASSELKVRDEAGNITTLSPHNFSLIPSGPSEELAWSYYSEKKGKKINVDMLKLARLVESLTDEQLVYIQ
jgi:hypothetical protein